MHSSDDPDLAREILKYLAGNPEGMDTLEGIARFWVLRRKIEENVDEVKRAIVKMIEEQYLNERVLRNESGEVVERYYHLNTSRLPEIETLLKKKTSRRKC
jgi:hypothetical protein